MAQLIKKDKVKFMKKHVIKNDVYYSIAWSPLYQYDKYSARRILPELSGIVSLLYVKNNRPDYLIFYSCWRDGCRVGLRKLLDPDFTFLPELLNDLEFDYLYYKYTVVDGKLNDMQDVMYWLINTYNPKFNNAEGFTDSKRYSNISIKEFEMGKDDVVEKIPGNFNR